MESDILIQQLIQHAAQPQILKNFFVSYLKTLGFNVQEGIGKSAPADIAATIGHGEKHLLLCGYYDVLPLKSKEWSYPPFSGKAESEMIFGRGVTSLGTVACAISALTKLNQQGLRPHISLYLSAKGAHALNTLNNSTLQTFLQTSPKIDTCLSITPLAQRELGENIAIGSKGCVIFQIKSFATSGNPSSQSERANPLHNMVDFLFKIKTYPIDSGNEYFDPSTLQILHMESTYAKEDELPESVTATIGVYYNSRHTKEEIVDWMRKNLVFSRGQFEMSHKYGPESYLSQATPALEQLQSDAHKVLGIIPTAKGDSIPNFAWCISRFLPMLSLGLPANKMHCCDEAVHQADVKHLTQIYQEFFAHYCN